MKKNKLFVLGLVTVFVALVSLTLVSSTWAKYTTSASGEDSARVAYWGFDDDGVLEISNLFVGSYGDTVKGSNDVIAPGTTNSASFTFNYKDKTSGIKAPEVAYTFTVDTTDSQCDALIENNPNIVWKLDNGDFGTWTELLAAIKALSGDASGTKEYAAGKLPSAFSDGDPGSFENDTHTITWKWVFDETSLDKETGMGNNDSNDTIMGNTDSNLEVILKIKITATQID